MAENTSGEIITLDGVDYKIDDMSENAKNQLESIKFVAAQVLQLNNEWAVADTARIGYTNALKAELTKTEKSE